MKTKEKLKKKKHDFCALAIQEKKEKQSSKLLGKETRNNKEKQNKTKQKRKKTKQKKMTKTPEFFLIRN